LTQSQAYARLQKLNNLKPFTMKKILLVVLTSVIIDANAQYFEHVYGTKQFEEIGSGMNTNLTGPGFLLGGTRTSTNGVNRALSVIRTDLSGNVPGAPYFKNNYGIYFNGSLTPIMRVNQVFVTELSPTRFGIAGVCYKDQTLQKWCVYYAQVDQAGNPMPGPLVNMKYYDIGTDSYYQVRNIRLSTSGNELYIVGLSINNTTGKCYTMVLKIDVATGNLIWSSLYSITGDTESAYDAVEDPITNELVVVGYYNFNATGSQAYIMRLNAATGNIVTGSNTLLFNSSIAGTNELFTCITLAAGGGYLIGGQTNMANQIDSWTMKLDNLFNVVWNIRLDYSSALVDNYAIDIMERINTLGQPEVYVAGQTLIGFFGAADIEVYKLDGATGACLNQFTYGAALNQYVASIDQNNSGTFNGFSLFGLTDINTPLFANNDFCLFKNYYNGITQCDYNSSITASKKGPSIATTAVHTLTNTFNPADCWLQLAATFTDQTICTATTVPGGNNARIAQNPTGINNTNADDDAPFLLLDPHNKTLTIKGAEGYGQPEVVDMSGRVIAVSPQVSENETLIDISHLAPGIYLLKIGSAGNNMITNKFIKD
jgi:hypothetical protein